MWKKLGLLFFTCFCHHSVNAVLYCDDCFGKTTNRFVLALAATTRGVCIGKIMNGPLSVVMC